MAAGTSVCRRFSDDRMSPELPTTSISGLQLSTSLLKRFSQQQQQTYWRLSSFPPTTGSSFTQQQFKAPKKLGSDQNCCLCASLPPPPPFTCSFKFSIFGGPLQSVLRSQSIVQMHMNKMLFGGLQVGPVRMATVDTVRKEVQGTTLPDNTPPPLPHMETVVGDSTEMAVTPDVFHSQLHNDITFQEADHESIDSDCDQDSEADEYDCDSDSEGDEGWVQFSPELDCDDQTETLTPNPISYMSLYSDESGFCENGSDSQGSFEEWSDCENESEEIDCEANDSLWNSFEQLAISPLHVCAYQHTETCPIASANRTDSNDTDTTLETFSDTEGMECTINILSPREAQCEDNHHKSNSKRVTFKPDSELVVVHRLIAWDYAYRACRRGPWEEYARDRMHFKRRIESVACVLEPCLARKLTSCPVT